MTHWKSRHERNPALHSIRYTILHIIGIKSLFISKSNWRKEFSDARGAVVSDSLILFFSRLGKHYEPNRKRICKRTGGVVICITTVKLISQNSARRGKKNDSFENEKTITYFSLLFRPSKNGRANAEGRRRSKHVWATIPYFLRLLEL